MVSYEKVLVKVSALDSTRMLPIIEYLQKVVGII
jgi:hypothetical protein